MPSSKMQPALFGGLVLGVLSALPVVSAANLCCCMWLIAGGVVAAYVLQSNEPRPITTGDGALAGLLAGVVGSAVYLVISVPISLLTGPLQSRWVERIETRGDIPEPMRPVLEAMRQGGVTVLGLVFGFFVMLVLAAIFSTAGGAIGAALFRKKTPPLPPPPVDYERPPGI